MCSSVISSNTLYFAAMPPSTYSLNLNTGTSPSRITENEGGFGSRSTGTGTGSGIFWSPASACSSWKRSTELSSQGANLDFLMAEVLRAGNGTLRECMESFWESLTFGLESF